jgi:anti-sigma regulatory factor (Ser/Thr protein kinase)
VSGSIGVVSARPAGTLATEHGSGAGTASPDWANVSLLKLGAFDIAPGCGRDHARHVLIEWGMDSLIDDAVLITSELLTNAVQASRTLGTVVPTPIALRLLANERQLIIEAWDQWVEGFDLKRSHSADEHGRGLLVVEVLSNRWGVGRINDHYKVVWAELLTRPALHPAATECRDTGRTDGTGCR